MKQQQPPHDLSSPGWLKDWTEVRAFLPSASSLRTQTLKLDGEKLDGKEEEEDKGPTKSGDSE